MTAPRRWPDEVRARALELLAEHRNATRVREQLVAETGNPDDVPARTTLIGWARRAGIVLDLVDPNKAAAVETATAARTEADAVKRLDLSRVLRDRLARPAAELLAARIVEAEEDEELVRLARRRYLDAAKVEEQAGDLGPDAAAGARRATVAARKDLEVVLDLRLDTRDLVGIVTRAVVDHLRLEDGLNGDRDDDRAPITVIFDIPESDRTAEQEARA